MIPLMYTITVCGYNFQTFKKEWTFSVKPSKSLIFMRVAVAHDLTSLLFGHAQLKICIMMIILITIRQDNFLLLSCLMKVIAAASSNIVI